MAGGVVAADRPRWRVGEPVTPLEQRLLDAAAAGETLIGEGDPADPTTTSLRAEVLCHLLGEPTWQVSAKGVRLSLVRIDGELDLEFQTLRCPLLMGQCVVASDGPVNLNCATAPGIGLAGCRLPGLSGIALRVSTVLDLSFAKFAGPVDLRAARIDGELVAKEARFEGKVVALSAENLHVEGNVMLNNVTTTDGGINLCGARIAGLLQCTGANLGGAVSAADGTACSLLAEWIDIGSSLRINVGFTAAHTIMLLGARVGGNFNCRGAVLNGANFALNCERLSVGGNLLAEGLSTTAGGFDLRGADIGGALQCSGASLRGALKAPGGAWCALFGEWMHVGGPIRLNQKFTATNTVWLLGSRIDANLNLRKASLAGPTCALQGERIKVAGNLLGEDLVATMGNAATGGCALNLQSAEIDGNLKLDRAQLVSSASALRAERLKVGGDPLLEQTTFGQGAVSLAGANIAGRLRWAPAQVPTAMVTVARAAVGGLDEAWSYPNGGWPAGGLLHLDGFAYGDLDADRVVSVGERLDWVRSQWPAQDGSARFGPGPYEKLAGAYHRSGHDVEARAVAIARRRDKHRFEPMTKARALWDRVLYATIRYGYESWRAVLLLAAVFVVAIAVFSLAARHANLLVPVTTTAAGHAPPPVTKCTSEYPCFEAVGYSIDTVVPLINVHQAAYWAPNASTTAGVLLTVFTWLCTALGWLLATLTLAGVTGVIQGEQST